MHIAIIGAAALILFLLIGALFVSAVVMEQRTRRRMAVAGAPIETAETAPVAEAVATEKAKTMAATAGR